MQLTLAATLAGVALGQLLAGPASDRYGRKRPMLAGLGLHLVASLLVTVAPTVATLGLLRLLQGLGAAAVAVTANAIVRDLYSGAAMATLLSRLILVIGVAPVLAPTVGGALLTTTSWRGIFVALALVAVGLAVLASRGLAETLPPERRSSGGVRGTLTAYRRILGDRTFVGLVLVAGLAFGSLFAYVSGSPFVLQEQYGLSQQQFALTFGTGALALIAATQVNVRLLRTRAPEQVLQLGLGLAVVAALILLATASTGAGGLAGLLAPLWLGLGAVGFCLPNSAALALSRHGEAAGTAAALLGAGQFGVGALAAPLVGLPRRGRAGDGDHHPGLRWCWRRCCSQRAAAVRPAGSARPPAAPRTPA